MKQVSTTVQRKEAEIQEKVKVSEKLNEEQQIKAKEKERKEFFKRILADGNTEYFDPFKEFGTIDGKDAIMYDDITTSYEAILPPEYYMKQIQKQLPKTDDKSVKNNQWFIRPHHLESLTNHYRSIKDDFLNTHYYSHYNMSYGVEPQTSDKEHALKKLERYIQQLKMKQAAVAEDPWLGINLNEVK